MLTLNDGRNELWQWDTGRKLTVDADCSQVHFSNKVFGRSVDVDVVDSVAIIPDILLQTDKDLSVWAFVGTPENGYTKISKVFKVNKRNKPADYVFTPPEQTTLDELVERLEKIEESQDPDSIKNAVKDYLQNNPIHVDEKDPTVPDWAKQPEKPKYTATEVGALPSTTNIPSKTSELINDSGFVNNVVANLVNYYLKSETYSRDEVKQLISAIPKFSIKPVSKLPTTDISETTIYLVPGGDGDDLYTEYIRVSGKWEILGSQKMDLTGYATEQFVKEQIAEAELGGEEVDLSGYAQKSELPTKVSQLQNDSGYLTAVPDGYAKTEDIPKNASDIGAQPEGDYALRSEIPSVPVKSVNGKTGTVSLTATDVKARPDSWMPSASDVGALPSSTVIPTVPTKLSAFTNDSGFITGYTETDPTVPSWAKQANKPSYTASEVGALPNTTKIPSKTSDLTNDSGFITGYTETDPTVPAWAKNATKPRYSKSEVGLGNVDNVKQYSASNPPPYPVTSVNGKTGTVTVTVPTVPTKVSAFENDKGYLTEHQDISDKIDISAIVQGTGDDPGFVMSQKAVTEAISKTVADLKAQGVQQVPLFANSIEECTDTTKLYVLPDGFIYAYQYVEATGPSYTNLAGTITYDKRLSSSGKVSSSAMVGACYTDFIPVKKGDIVRIKNLNIYDNLSSSAYPYICFYTGASESNVTTTSPTYIVPGQHVNAFNGLADTVSGGVASWTAFVISTTGTTGNQHTNTALSHIRISGKYFSDKEVIVTVNEEITEGGSTGGYQWVNTGHAFVPADYEAEIFALQQGKANKSEIPTKLPNPKKLTIDGVQYDGSTSVNIETQSGGNILYGKKWVACGDSFTANGYNASDGFDESVYIYQDGRFAGRYKVYPNIIGLRNNMNIVNLATGGQTMATSSNSFMTRYANIDADADYITLMFGINDKLQGIPVGNLTDAVNTTFCGAFNLAMEHILENHPFAHIGIMVSHGTNEEIMEATRGIAERWGVPYLDYGSPQVPLMNRYTGRNVCAKAQEIREKNFCVISDGTTATNGHPNTAAHEFESTFIEAWLRTL